MNNAEVLDRLRIVSLQNLPWMLIQEYDKYQELILCAIEQGWLAPELDPLWDYTLGGPIKPLTTEQLKEFLADGG